MKRKLGLIAFVCGVVVLTGLTSWALMTIPDYIEMQSNYIWTGVNSSGTLGVGDGDGVGILFDPTGKGNFNTSTDFMRWGTPWEIFSVKGYGGYLYDAEGGEKGPLLNGGGWLFTNNNDDWDVPMITPTSLTQQFPEPGVQIVSWTGEVQGLFGIEHQYLLEAGSKVLNVRTRIWSLLLPEVAEGEGPDAQPVSGLYEVRFLRGIDPDQDAELSGAYATVNYRGGVINGMSIPAEQVVSAFGPASGFTIRLTSSPYLMGTTYDGPKEGPSAFMSGPYTNTGITGWSQDPDDYLDGTDVGDGDHTIGLAFSLGDFYGGNGYVVGPLADPYYYDGEWFYYAYLFDYAPMMREFPPMANELLNTNSRLVALELAGRGRASQRAAQAAAGQTAFLPAPQGVAGPDGEPQRRDLTLQGWVGGFGHWVDRDQTSSLVGSDTYAWGSLAGLDKTWCNFTAGVAAGTSRTVLEMDNRDSSEAESILTAVYATWTWDRFFVDSSFQFGWHEIDETYKTRNAEAEFNAQTYAWYLGGGIENVLCGETVYLTPEAGLMVGYYRAESHREQAQVPPGLDVDAYDRWSYLSRIGATLGLRERVSDSIVLKPELKVFWLHEFNDDDDALGYTFGGSGPLSARYRAPVDDTLEAGISLTAEVGSRYEIGVGITSELGRDYDSYSVDGRIAIRF